MHVYAVYLKHAELRGASKRIFRIIDSISLFLLFYATQKYG